MNRPHVLLVLYLVLTILGALLLLALKCRARDFRPFKSWTVTTPTRNLTRVLPAASFIPTSILILLLARNYNNGQTGFSPEEFQRKSDLWKGFIAAFESNDIIRINYLLDSGAPADCKDKYGDYSIHMAAPLGDADILQRTYLPASTEFILSRNGASETPLDVAIGANKKFSVKWILQQFRKGCSPD
ncbi:hypothetical protein B0J14DRAFT_636577 [Halenospora varia]|nr:hypothetical protein B0J14DRAFT_636577 [Halenospora varia]